MKTTLTLLTALLLAPLVANAQQTTSPDTVRDHLWLFAVPADGPRLYYEGAGYRGGSRITPAEGAFWLGVPNLMFITQDWNNPPQMSRERSWKAMTTKEQYAISFEPLKRVQWAAVGSGGRGGMAEVPDIVTLAKKYPNFTGIFLDDFFRPVTLTDGRKGAVPALNEAELKSMRAQLGKVGRPMEVWSVIYSHEFDPNRRTFRPGEPPLSESLKPVDVLVFFTWQSDELKDLEKNLAPAGGHEAEIMPDRSGHLPLGLHRH